VVVALSPTASGGRAALPCPPSRPASSTSPTARAAAAARAELAGVDAGTVETDLPAAAAIPAGSSGRRSPPDGGRDPLGHAHGRLLAGTARTVRTVVDRGRLLSPLASCWDLGTDPSGPLDPRYSLFLGLILKWHCSIDSRLETGRFEGINRKDLLSEASWGQLGAEDLRALTPFIRITTLTPTATSCWTCPIVCLSSLCRGRSRHSGARRPTGLVALWTATVTLSRV
jgi:hypothetical protein